MRKTKADIRTRDDLFRHLETQMNRAYRELRGGQRLQSESTLVKSYVFEVDPPLEAGGVPGAPAWDKFLGALFSAGSRSGAPVRVKPKQETGFYELELAGQGGPIVLYLDTASDARFWLGFSLSDARALDAWFAAIARKRGEFDFAWLWPGFLETVQKRGAPRGFGLDYDYRKFEPEGDEKTTYLKMQLWGGGETGALYDLLRGDPVFGDKTVLSKVRLREGSTGADGDVFALQDVKYTGKCTVRGTDLATHLATLSFVRAAYREEILRVEKQFALRWVPEGGGLAALEGSALHFIPDREIPVAPFYRHALNGTLPFRLLGIAGEDGESWVVVDVVDLHNGGKLSMEVYPDLMSVYLPAGTCANTLARLYTNLQHFFSVRFTVVADDGSPVFQSPAS